MEWRLPNKEPYFSMILNFAPCAQNEPVVVIDEVDNYLELTKVEDRLYPEVLSSFNHTWITRFTYVADLECNKLMILGSYNSSESDFSHSGDTFTVAGQEL